MSGPTSARPATTRTTSARAPRRKALPCRVRRTASALQPATWPAAVAATSHESTTTTAGSTATGATRNATTPSRVQAWKSQATLSGASSRAPRWSTTGLTGYAAAPSRWMISRPPPEATAAVTTSPTNARQPTGNRRRSCSTRSGSVSRPASIPTSRTAAVIETRDQPAEPPATGGALPGQPERDQGPQVRELVSPGARGRHRPRPPPPAGRPRGWRPGRRRAAPARHRTPPWPARAGAWRPAPRRRGHGRRR